MTFYLYGSTTTTGAKLVQPQLSWHRLEAEWMPMAPATNTFTHIHKPMWVKCLAPGQRLGEISNHQTLSYWTTLLPPWRAEEPQGLKHYRNYFWTTQHRKRKFTDFGCTFSSGEPRQVNKMAFVLLESTLVWIIFVCRGKAVFNKGGSAYCPCWLLVRLNSFEMKLFCLSKLMSNLKKSTAWTHWGANEQNYKITPT